MTKLINCHLVLSRGKSFATARGFLGHKRPKLWILDMKGRRQETSDQMKLDYMEGLEIIGTGNQVMENLGFVWR